jgi:hypothetical protein
VKEYRRGYGRFRRLKRYIPQGEIVRYMFIQTARRFIPAFETHLRRSAAIERRMEILTARLAAQGKAAENQS